MSTVTLNIEVDSKGAVTDVKNLDRNLDKLEKRTTSTAEKFKKFGMAIKIGLLAGVGAAVALTAAITKTINHLDKIGKTADKIGLTTDSLQELRFAAQQSGVATQALDVGIQRFSRRMAEASKGTGVLHKEFTALGIATKDSEGNMRDFDAVLNDYADAIKNAGSEQEQLRLAFAAFDTEGAGMVNMLRNGSAGLEEFRQEARDLGLVIDEKLVRGAEAASDELGRMSSVLSAKLTVALAGLIPYFIKVGNALVDFINYIGRATKAVQDFFTTSNAERLAEITAEITDLMGRGYKTTSFRVEQLVKEYKSLSGVIEQEAAKEKALDTLRKKANDTTEKSAKLTGELAKETKKLKKEIDPIAAVMKKYGFALEDISSEQIILDDLLDQGIITWDEYTEAMLGADEVTKKVAETTKTEVSVMDEVWKNFTKNVQESFGDLIYDNFKSILEDGKLTFKSFVDSLLDMFLRMIAEMVAAWATSKIAGLFGLGGGSMGGIGGIFSSAASGAASSGLGGIGSSIAGSAAYKSIFGGVATTSSGGGGGAIGSALLGTSGAASGTLPVTVTALPAGYMTPAVGTPLASSAGITSGGGTAAAGSSGAGAVAGAAFSVAAAAIVAKLIISSFGQSGAEKRAAMITDEFNVYREQGALAGEQIEQLSDNMRSFGEAGGSMWVGISEGAKAFESNTEGGKTELNKLKVVLKTVGASFDQFYNNNGEHMFRFNGDIEQAKLAINALGTETLDTMFSNATAIQSANEAMLGLGMQVDQTIYTVAELSSAILGIPDRDVNIHTNFTQSGSDASTATTATNYGSGYATPIFDYGSGYATGGSFMVGGSGGTDTTPVSFMATKGEKVTVETPEQQGSQAPIIIEVSGDGGGLENFIRVVSDDHRVQVNRSQVRATERVY